MTAYPLVYVATFGICVSLQLMLQALRETTASRAAAAYFDSFATLVDRAQLGIHSWIA